MLSPVVKFYLLFIFFLNDSVSFASNYQEEDMTPHTKVAAVSTTNTSSQSPLIPYFYIPNQQPSLYQYRENARFHKTWRSFMNSIEDSVFKVLTPPVLLVEMINDLLLHGGFDALPHSTLNPNEIDYVYSTQHVVSLAGQWVINHCRQANINITENRVSKRLSQMPLSGETLNKVIKNVSPLTDPIEDLEDTSMWGYILCYLHHLDAAFNAYWARIQEERLILGECRLYFSRLSRERHAQLQSRIREEAPERELLRASFQADKYKLVELHRIWEEASFHVIQHNFDRVLDYVITGDENVKSFTVERYTRKVQDLFFVGEAIFKEVERLYQKARRLLYFNRYG